MRSRTAPGVREQDHAGHRVECSTQHECNEDEALGADTERHNEMHVDALNQSIADIPADRFGIVDPDVAWMKLAALGQGAAEASERLWAPGAVTA